MRRRKSIVYVISTRHDCFSTQTEGSRTARLEFDDLFPQYQDIERPLLLVLYIKGGQSHAMRARDTYDPLADYFRLSDRARDMSRAEYFGDGKTELPVWDNMVQ